MIDRNHRFVLWIDSVASVLVCPQAEVWIGQALPAAGVHLAFQADLSRRHAKISRDSGMYWIHPEGQTKILGTNQAAKQIETESMLTDKQRFICGHGVELEFRKPHPFTSSAVIKCLSGHRMNPRIDWTVLMAEACLIGQSKQCHITVPGLEQATLFYQNDSLHMKCPGTITVSDQCFEDLAPLASDARVQTQWFEMTVEVLKSND